MDSIFKHVLDLMGEDPILFVEVVDGGRHSGLMIVNNRHYPLTSDKCNELAAILIRMADSLDKANREGKYTYGN